MKYSCITGSLGGLSDRFMSKTYRDDIAEEERIKGIADIKVANGVELCFNKDGYEHDPVFMKNLVNKYNLKISCVDAPLTDNKNFKFGSLTNTDSSVRAKAIQNCKDAIDFSKAVGCNMVNLWMGQDGFDYVFQTDYTRQWNLMVESIREVCDYAGDIKVALEFKPREPRNRCTLDTAGSTLLLAKDVGRKNVGVTIDVGHVFQSQGNISQVAEMCANHNMLYNMHINDNYGTWDDDMILGSVRYTEYIELCYSLRKVKYDGWVSVDIFPFREPSFRAVEESIRHFMVFDSAIDKIGYDKLTECINGTDATQVFRLIREAVFKN